MKAKVLNYKFLCEQSVLTTNTQRLKMFDAKSWDILKFSTNLSLNLQSYVNSIVIIPKKI